MLVIPAVDLKEGKCVRLLHGEASKETIYSDNPVEMAQQWVSQGAERLHVIDLDGAFEGESRNLDAVLKIKHQTQIPIQLGGGLRSLKAVARILEAGIDFVILGTIVFTDSILAKKIFETYGSRVMVAMDVREGMISIKGWTNSSGLSVEEGLKKVEDLGGQEIIFTDISRDGTLKGVNVDSIHNVMKKTKLKIYASGGVTTLEDIEKLKKINSPGCIVGKALYEGKINLSQAIQRAGTYVG